MFLSVPESALVPLEEPPPQRARRMDEDVITGSRYILYFLIRMAIIGWTVTNESSFVHDMNSGAAVSIQLIAYEFRLL